MAKKNYSLLFYLYIIKPLKLFKCSIISWKRMLHTMYYKKCYFGPFTGEFGHLLAHTVPFINYLHSKGVTVEFCGMGIHRCFFKDENGHEIVNSYLELRDFFPESPPDCNRAKEPADVQAVTSKFIEEARKSKYAYWDNYDHFYYFISFRWWALRNKFLKTNSLRNIYKTQEGNNILIFPRKWNNKFPHKVNDQLRNNGLNWDYLQICKIASKYFTKVYVVGHPVFAGVEFESFDNVEVCLTNNNAKILEICSNSNLIVTQHSGVNNLGVYTDTKVLMIYNGGREIGDISTTLAFRKGIGEKYPLDFAYTYEEIENYFSNFSM